MTSAWIEGAQVINGVDNGGSMTGHDAYATWHSTENDPHTTSAANIARYLNQTRNIVHVVWNPEYGQIVVMLPPNVAGRGLMNAAGGVETNRQGKVNIQIEVVARAAQPFTAGPMRGREKILAALHHFGVKDVWPAGPPLPANQAYGPNRTRSVAKWNASGGHFSHSQVPENDHADPGAIDIHKLLGGVPTQPAKPAVVPPNAPAPTFHVENGDGKYERGEEGPGIKTLQAALNKAGFNCGTPDGFFGANTESAVNRLKRAHHLAEDGIAGPRVLHILGMDHVDPKGPGLKVDGKFGTSTMKALQQAVGLRGADVDGWFAYSAPYSYNFGKTTTAVILHHLKSSQNVIKAIQHALHLTEDGKMGHDTIVALQRALNAGKF